MVDYNALALTAQRLIESNARTVTFRRQNTTVADSSKPWRGPSATISSGSGGATLQVPMCFVPASGGGLGKDLMLLAGTMVSPGEQQGLVASLSTGGVMLDNFEGGTLLDGSKTWQIVRASELRPSTVSLLWVVVIKA